VAWSECLKEDFDSEYWNGLWRWYEHGGNRHVAAYLAELDISDFDRNAAPPQTEAFWAIVDAGGAPEEAEMADVLEEIGNPEAVILSEVIAAAKGDFEQWLNDRKNRRTIPHRLEACGYVAVRNGDAKDRRWRVGGKNVMIYARTSLTKEERLAAARKRADREKPNILRPAFGARRRWRFRGA
jgi:hypothetical protein